VDFDRRGEGLAAFCRRRAARLGPASPMPPAEVLLGALSQDLRRAGAIRSMDWVWLCPNADPFTPVAPELAGATLRMAEILIRHGLGITIRTRGGLEQAQGLLTLARRYPGQLRVEIGFFSEDRVLARRWERGLAPMDQRLGLATALLGSGAEVVGRVGPIIPLINDGERRLVKLARALGRVGIHTLVPEWIEDGPGLTKQIKREVCRSRAQMIAGWFDMERSNPHEKRRQLPERVRRHVLSRLHKAADSGGQNLVVCPCSSRFGKSTCLSGPHHVVERTQLDLFGEQKSMA